MKINRNQLFLPINYEVLIDENDPVWKVVEICDTLNYTRLYDEYFRHWRSIDPVVMFEILVFAYMNRIYSSRAIEQACKTDIRFMWLLQGQSAPDHATIARFQNERLTDVIEDLFVQLIMKLHKIGEISFLRIEGVQRKLLEMKEAADKEPLIKEPELKEPKSTQKTTGFLKFYRRN